MGSEIAGVARLDYSHRVLGEMGELLARIRQLTVDVVEHPEDSHALLQLMDTVRQSHNTFRMIECFGAELLTSELQLLLQAMQQRNLDEKADPSPVLVLASEKLTEYIEFLKAGGQDLPLALLTLVNNMRACRGVGLLSEALIVSPHFQIPEVTVRKNVDAAAEKEFFNVVRRTRLPLMRDLVSWFKQPEKSTMQPLISAFANLQISSPSPEMASLWAAARALAVSIADKGLESNAAVKMLLGQLERFLQRLDQQSRLQADPDFPVNLFKNLLYYVALSTSKETSVSELKKQYRLAELLPPRSSLEIARGALGGPGARLSEAICNSLGQELSEVRSVLDSVAAQSSVDGSMIDDAVNRLRQVSYTLLLLGLNHARLLNDRAVEQLGLCRERDNYTELQDIAADVLRVDGALEEYLHGNGRPAVFADDFKAPEAGSDKLSSYQYNLIVEQCLFEASRSLQSVQADYLAVLTDQGGRSQLTDSSALLDSVASALQILPLPELKPLLCGAAVYLRRVAQGITSLSTIDPLMSASLSLETRFIDATGQHPGYAASNAEQQQFAELMVCSELYLDSALQRQPAAADLLVHADDALNRLLNDVDENDQTTSINSPFVVAQASTSQTTDVVDQDMMAVFIDEALSAFGVINNQLAHWKQQKDPESLERIRRQYHTLKGSGIVAGAPTLSVFASANEDMLDHFIRVGHSGNPADCHATSQERSLVAPMVAPMSASLSDRVESLLNESSAVLPQLINQLSHPAQAGLVEIDGLDELQGRIRAVSNSGSPIATDLASTSAIDIFDQTISTNTSVDELSQTLSLQAESEDMTSTVSMHDLGGGEHTRTISLELDDSNSSATAGTDTTAHSLSPLDIGDDSDFTRTIALSEQSELSAPADQSEFTQTVSLAVGSDVSLDNSISQDATQVLGGAGSEDTAAYSLDNTLLRVFYTECLSHVALLKDLLSPNVSDITALPSVEMQRSLHTMRGSAHTADVPSIAKLVGPLEDIANAKLSRGEHFDRKEVALVKDVIHALELQVDALSEGRQVPPIVAEMNIRLGEFTRQARQSRSGSGASSDLQELYIEEATELLGNIHASIDQLREGKDHLAHVNHLRADLHTLKGGARVAQFNAIADITHALEGALTRWVKNLPVPALRLDKLQEVADAITVNLDQAKTGGSLGQFDWLISELGSDDQKPEPINAGNTATEELFELTQLIPTPYTQLDFPTNDSSLATQVENTALDADISSSAADKLRVTDSVTAATGSSASTDLVKLDAAAIARLSELSTEVSIHQARVGDYFNDLRDSLIDLDKTTDRLRYKLRDLQRETDSTLSFLENTLDMDAGTDATTRLEPADLERFTRRREDSRQLSEILADFDAIRSRLHDRMRGSQESLSLTSRIGSDIQQSLMRTQLIRFSQHSQRLSSTIRQTAAALDKSVDWELQGGDCSIDRSLHKELLVPLEHLIRNAIAHGVEKSTLRRERGKPEIGSIKVAVRFDGNDLVLGVSDDGAGVDFDAVRQRLGGELDDQAVLDSLFKSGLTTVSEPNQYAGRGVGLDVVARALSALNGSVSISSEQGQGTTVTLRIPQRVVIHQVVLVELDDSVFGIPVNNVHTVVAVEDESAVVFNDQEYKTLRLSDLLGHAPQSRSGAGKLANQAILIEAGGQRVALRVNEVPGYRELIARPLGRQVSSLNIYTGGSILSNGRSVLILDLNRLLSEAGTRLSSEPLQNKSSRPVAADILVVDDSVTMRTYAERILTSQGYTAVFARDGIEALERLRDFTPDLVLLDIEMPRMDGFELLEKLRANPALKELPVVIVSSRSSMKHRRRASELGVQNYVVKPYREEELIRLLDRVSSVPET